MATYDQLKYGYNQHTSLSWAKANWLPLADLRRGKSPGESPSCEPAFAEGVQPYSEQGDNLAPTLTLQCNSSLKNSSLQCKLIPV